MKSKLLFTLAFMAMAAVAQAQQFGAFPPSTKWRQIKTDTAIIIYEAQSDSVAQNIAAIIHQLNRNNPNPLGTAIRRVPIVLHKNTTQANGYVALGPFRSEYYLVPSPDVFRFGATPWQQTLAVHEYRHVHQFSNFNTGLSKIAGVLFGQEGQAAFNSLSIPDWFFEGDAVHSETIRTLQGRGRAPDFFNLYKSIWQEGRAYSWMKLRNGSLKDRVPDHYPLGYMLVNYGYLKYGNQFWKNVTQDALTLHGTLGLFSSSIKKYTGQSFKTFREEALQYYSHEVSTRRDGVKKHEALTDYLYARQIGPDSVLYVKKSFSRLPAFYLKTGGAERRIKLRSITTDDWFSYRNGTLVYTGYNTSARWALTDYSNIVLLNVTTGKEQRITSKAKYFTPDISPDGTSIVAVNFTDSTTSELHLLSRDGVVQTKLKAAPGALFVHPRYAADGSIVVAVRSAASTMGIQRYQPATGKWQTLLPFGAAIVGYPSVDGARLYFVSSQSGNDEVYEADLSAELPVQKATQLTFNQTGNYYPSVSGDTLTYSHFTSNGYRLVRTSVRNKITAPLQSNYSTGRVAPYKIALADSTPNVLAIAAGKFTSSPYKKSTGLFNFHSYRPNYTDPEITYSIYGDNILSTFSNEIFYRYNLNESSSAVGFTTFYGALFPVLNAGLTYTGNRTIKTTARTYTLNQWEARGGFTIPLNFTGGKTYKFLNFGSNYVYSQLTPTGAFKNLLQARTASYLVHNVSFTQQLPRAVQQIFPKLGYAVSLQHRHLLNGNGYQALGGATFYLPSIANHSIVLAANVQETDTLNATFSNRFANSRGYNDYYFSRMWRVSGNYHFPLFYPDWGFWSVLYFQRIRAAAFYDYTRVYSRSKTLFAEQRSVGGELYADTKVFGSAAVSIGFRISHLLDDDFSGTRPKGTNRFEIVVPLNLIPN